MQGRRSSTGPFPETLSFGDASTSDDSSINQQICFNNMQNFAHNNTLEDYFTSSNSPNIVYSHFPTQQGHNFDGWTMAGPSSIVPENYNSQSVHVQSSNIALPQDLNVSNNINDDSDDCQILETQPVPFNTTLDPLWGPSSGSVNLLDSRRKRKSLERNRKQSSKGEGSSSFQQSQIGVWRAVPSGHNAGSSLSSSNQLQNASGISSGEVSTERPFAPHLNGNSQNLLSNYQARISPSHRVDPPPLNFPLTRMSPQLPASIPFSPNNLLVQNSNTQTQSSALHAASSRRTQSTSRLTEGSSSRRWYSSSSRQRNELLLGDPITLPRNLPDHHPVFIPTNDLRNSPGSSLGVQLPEPNGISHQNPPPQYSQRLSELVRRSLLASGNNGGQGNDSAVPPGISSRASNGGHRLLYSRSRLLLDRQRDGATGLPHSLRGLSSGGEGRGRLVSEIRNVLDLVRRGDNLRPEDIALLDHSMLLGMTSIHDRHRDMRLDTDNMSYEELLALEERIGNVNTGLNEGTILNCLVQRKHFSSAMTTETEVEPCCVCQENYNDGEDLGTLECGHEFHSDCIKRWLMLKNLCPICKTTALTI